MSYNSKKMNDSAQRGERNTIQIAGWGWRGGILQLIFITVLPLTILLLLVAFGSIAIHQRAMRLLVGERDERTVRTAAAALNVQIDQRTAAIQDLSRQITSADPSSLDEVLSRSSHLMRYFDGGLAVFRPDGTLLASAGDKSSWERLPAEKLVALFPPSFGQVTITDAFAGPAQNGLWVAISSFVEGTGNEPADGAVLLGAFSPGELAQSTLANAFMGRGQGTVMLFDVSKTLLYHGGELPTEANIQDHLGVAEALAGQSGASFTPATDGEHVVAYTPIEATGWALLFEEPWEMVASPALSYTQMAPLVLVPVLLLTLFALWFGVRQIVQPLQALEEQADALAWGNYNAVEKPVGGIAEIRRLQTGLIHMAQKVRAAQQSLHRYIGAITAGQEEERRRLARELHDDTIQSLIALKQRVQLAQLNQANGSTAQTLSELEELTEKTIADLRRVTRALRPIYLEDLGLLAALEMLTREMTGLAGIEIDFRTSGHEQRLSPKVELALYRIAQEALNNVVHHAQATQASVSLAFTPGEILLEVMDNGKGFEVPRSPADFAPSGHYGLLGLFERAELIEADLRIDSAVGEGTRISVRLNPKKGS